MTKYFVFSLVYCFAFLTVKGQADKNLFHIEQRHYLEGISVRAIEVINDSVVWFAGSGGYYGKISNKHLVIDSIQYEKHQPSFRSIAFNGQQMFLLSIESPALLFKIETTQRADQTPLLVYKETHPNSFYDSMTFANEHDGWAIGDPIDGCLSIINSNDGGRHWKKLACSTLPRSEAGEGAFAASNTNISAYRNHLWIATGGKSARIFKSDDAGKTWSVNPTPIVQGEKMTGIFSMDFYNEHIGIIMGGNWEDKSSTVNAKAISTDGGNSWKLIANNELPGYISCVQFVPNGYGKKIMACSTEGIYYSHDRGQHWTKISHEGFYSLRMIDDESAWFSGHEKMVKIKFRNL